MALRIYNTLTRKKEELVSLNPGEVRVYSCGVTVYDLCHVGHARSAMVFDVICRYLAFKGYRVIFVRNFTNVDDKVIRRAQQEGVPASEISERYIAEFRADMRALGVLPPPPEITYYDPKATDFIPEMVALIERLVAKGFAYVVDGDVYFEIARFPRYGRLSGKNLDELLAGARVEVDERKRDPRDFALWKAAKPGEPAWPSPWGEGRPGWHIECSVMSMHYLGESFDIHGGGTDLIFPHHECEIAQSEADTGLPFARYWVHNGLVNLSAEKMSKSLGNFVTVKELVGRHDPDALRLSLLGTHYRNPLEFAESHVVEAARALARIRSLLEEADRLAAKGTPAPGQALGLFGEVSQHRERFQAAMDDDFNTPQALGVLFDLARSLQSFRNQIAMGKAAVGPLLLGINELLSLCRVLGLAESVPRAPVIASEIRERIERLVGARAQARARRDWVEADRIRQELARLGVTVEDTRQGTIWKWKP